MADHDAAGARREGAPGSPAASASAAGSTSPAQSGPSDGATTGGSHSYDYDGGDASRGPGTGPAPELPPNPLTPTRGRDGTTGRDALGAGRRGDGRTSAGHDGEGVSGSGGSPSAADDETADPETTPQALPGHEPDAQIRPLPGGVPRPRTRRPAYREPVAPSSSRGGGRRSLMVALGAGVLVLALVVGGTVLALWAPWRGEDQASSPTGAASSGAASSGGGSVTLRDGVTAALVDVQVGIGTIGEKGAEHTPEGEYTAVTLTITNDSAAPVSWQWNMSLVAADGTEIAPDEGASRASEGGGSAVIAPGETAEVTVVFDVPFGADPATARIELEDGGEGDLALP